MKNNLLSFNLFLFILVNVVKLPAEGHTLLFHLPQHYPNLTYISANKALNLEAQCLALVACNSSLIQPFQTELLTSCH